MVRTVIFGIEDALVSTTGVVAGLSTGVEEKSVIILGSLITVAVEALSMSAGSYLSEEAAHQMQKNKKASPKLWLGALLMFLSYLLAGMIPVLPLFFLPIQYSALASIICAFFGLFTLGYIKGKVVHVAPTQSAIKMLLIGGMAVLVGSAVGWLLKIH